MAMGKACKCGFAFRYVVKRNYNESAFNGYHRTPSDYSTVACAKCGNRWRSKSNNISSMPDAPPKWWRKNNGQIRAALRMPEPERTTANEND